MRRRGSLSTVLLCAGLCACSSAPPSAEPRLTERGRHLVQYESPQIRGELASSWADTHLGDEWLVIKLTLTAGAAGSTVVRRDGVRVRTPGGYDIVMIDQGEFRRIYGQLRTALDRIDAWGPPTARFTGFERPCRLWFLTPPGSFTDRSSLRINPGEWCSGPLVFQVPIGVQPGRWLLTVDLEEGDLRIPFVLGG